MHKTEYIINRLKIIQVLVNASEKSAGMGGSIRHVKCQDNYKSRSFPREVQHGFEVTCVVYLQEWLTQARDILLILGLKRWGDVGLSYNLTNSHRRWTEYPP